MPRIGIGTGVQTGRGFGDGFINTLSTLFDGVDEFITIPDDASIATDQPFSVSLWIKPTAASLTLFHVLMAKGSTNPINNLDLLLVNGRVQAFNSILGTQVLTAGNWFNIIYAVGGTNETIYINGAIDKQEVSEQFGNEAGPLIIGRTSEASIQFYGGNIDEMAFWNKELTLTDAQTIYNSGTPLSLLIHPSASNLVSYWRMGDGDTFPIITDQKGSNDGTLTNMESSDFVLDTPP